MSPLEFLVCTAAVGQVAEVFAARQSLDYRSALAHNVCAAAKAEAFPPEPLVALVLNENRRLDTAAVGPAVAGRDVGLCQINSAAHGKAVQSGVADHPYYCVRYAAQIIKRYKRVYGNDWRTIASYWSPLQAQQQTAGAKEYYRRWSQQLDIVNRTFASVRSTMAKSPVDFTGAYQP